MTAREPERRKESLSNREFFSSIAATANIMNLYRRALITGATSGIGAAFAHELPRTTDLLLSGRDEERLRSARDALSRKGRTVETHAADLTDDRAVQGLIERADSFGVDLLINNAGVGRFGRLIDNDPVSERDTAMLNVVAVVMLTRGLLPGMIRRAIEARRRGGVVIVSSTAAFAPVPFFATYAASKAFNLYLAEALAEEMRDDPVDVLALCPGATRTAFGKRAGLDGGPIPGAADPGAVARQALDALGTKSVQITGRLSQAALGPFLVPRRAVRGALARAMRCFKRSRL